MNGTLLKTLLALLPACILFSAAVVGFVRGRDVWSLLQLLGAAGMMVVLLAHLCEALRLLPWMGWGRENSIGHYIDLVGAVLGLSLFPLGYLVGALTRRPAEKGAPVR